MKSFVFLLISFVFGNISNAQIISSDINNLLRHKSIEEQIKIVDSAAVSIRDVRPQEALNLLKYNLSIEKQNQLHKEFINTLLITSRTYRNLGSFDTAQRYVDTAMMVAENYQLKSEYGRIHDFRGLIYLRVPDYEKAIESFHKSLNSSLALKDSLILYDAYNHLGTVYFYRYEYKKALSYYKRALDYFSKTIQKKRPPSIYDNIGICYTNLNRLDSALYFQMLTYKALNLSKDSLVFAETCLNIGSTYMKLKDLEKALPFLEQARAINTNLKIDYGQIISNLYLGQLYIAKKDYDRAIKYLILAKELAYKINYLNQIKEVSLSLSKAYAGKGDYKNAYKYSSILAEVSTQLYQEENVKALNELTTKFETQQKQQQILLLTKDGLLKQETIKHNRIIFSITAGVLLLGCLFFIYRFRKKKKDNEILHEKNIAIAHQKQQIEKQKEELQQKNTEITDSINYARRIQSLVIPSDQYMKEILPHYFVYFVPKDIVSGDFYWVSNINNRIYFAVVDCTGHGVPGAMMSMLASSLLDKIINTEQVVYPADILKELHKEVVTTLNENITQRDTKDGMDIALIMYEEQSNRLYFSGAGRPLYIINKGELQIIKGDKNSIGDTLDTETASFSQHEVNILPDMYIYLFSDGVPDQFGGDNSKKLMVKNLQQILLNISNKPVLEQYWAFKSAFEGWKRNTDQTDDVCMAGIKFL